MIKIFKKTFFLIFICFILTTLFIYCHNPEEDIIDIELANKVFESIKFKNKDLMTRKEFENFLFRLITRDEGKNHPQYAFYKAVTIKFSKGLPQEIPFEKLNEYINKERLIKSIEDVVREQYGEEYVTQLEESYKNIEKEMENVSDEEAEDFYKKSQVKKGKKSNSYSTEYKKNHTEL